MHPFWMWWQNIPAYIHPVALTVGGLPVYWYALFFLCGAGVVYIIVGKEYQNKGILDKQQYQDFAFGVFVSALLGGKAGFLVFYWWPFLQGSQFSWFPVTSESGFGLPGMSFIGGAVGVTGFLFWYARKYQKNFFTLSDILVVFLPLAFFFGRLGNFFHNELLGKATTVPWGMYFPHQTFLRHPSTLYAAILEGLVLFSILYILFTRKKLPAGILTAWFAIGYGTLRFFSEFFREPDWQIGYIGMLTLNQIMAAGIIVIGTVVLAVKKGKNTL